MHDHSSHHHGDVAELPRDTTGLPEAHATELVELGDGDEFRLEIVPVKKQIGDATVRMLTYNGCVPGPTLKVPQGATITVPVTNHGDIEATVHWRAFNQCAGPASKCQFAQASTNVRPGGRYYPVGYRGLKGERPRRVDLLRRRSAPLGESGQVGGDVLCGPRHRLGRHSSTVLLSVDRYDRRVQQRRK